MRPTRCLFISLCDSLLAGVASRQESLDGRVAVSIQRLQDNASLLDALVNALHTNRAPDRFFCSLMVSSGCRPHWLYGSRARFMTDDPWRGNGAWSDRAPSNMPNPGIVYRMLKNVMGFAIAEPYSVSKGRGAAA